MICRSLTIFRKVLIDYRGASGIGLEVVRHFAMEGALLTLFDVHLENLEREQEDLKKITTVYVALVDVSKENQTELCQKPSTLAGKVIDPFRFLFT